MARSKRAIRNHTPLVLVSSILGAAALFSLTSWLWQRAVLSAHEKGPVIVEKRLTHLFAKEVHVKAINLSFPPQISLEGFSLSSPQGTKTHIKATRLEIKFSLLSLLACRLKPKEITIISPDIKIIQTAPSSFPMPKTGPFATTNARGKELVKRGWPTNIKPSSWPIIIDPERVKIIDGRLHIEDESDTLPQLTGRFNLNMGRSEGKGSTAIHSGHLSLKETSFFFKGLRGELSGTIEFSKKQIKSFFRCQPEGGGTLDIQTKVSNIIDAPTHSFEIKANDFDLKNLALLKFPLVTIPESTIVSGNFSADSPLLYGKRFSSLSAGISHSNGIWSIKAINLQFTDNRGTITGSIMPGVVTESFLAKATLTYTGKIPPDLQIYDEELIQLDPTLWKTPVTLSSDLTLDLASYPMQVTTLKLMGNNGDIFANGTVDLFSGFINMQGTYLKPLAAGKHTSKDIPNIATEISLVGPITHPVLRLSPSMR